MKVFGLIAGLLVGCSSNQPCTRDLDCKAERVCEEGACREPDGSPVYQPADVAPFDPACSFAPSTCPSCELEQLEDDCGSSRVVACACSVPAAGHSCETATPITTFPASLEGKLADFSQSLTLTCAALVHWLRSAFYSIELAPDEGIVVTAHGKSVSLIEIPDGANVKSMCEHPLRCTAGGLDTFEYENVSGRVRRVLLVVGFSYPDSLDSHFNVEVRKIPNGETCALARPALASTQRALDANRADYRSSDSACSSLQGKDRVYTLTVPARSSVRVSVVSTIESPYGVSIASSLSACERFDCEGTRLGEDRVVWENASTVPREVYVVVSCEVCSAIFSLSTFTSPLIDCESPAPLPASGLTLRHQFLDGLDSFPAGHSCGAAGSDTVFGVSMSARTATTATLRSVTGSATVLGATGRCGLDESCRRASDDSLVLFNQAASATNGFIIVDGDPETSFKLGTTSWGLSSLDGGALTACGTPTTIVPTGRAVTVDLAQGEWAASDSCLSGAGRDAVVAVPLEGGQRVVVVATPLDGADVSLALADSSIDCEAGRCSAQRNTSGPGGPERFTLENGAPVSRAALVRLGSQSAGRVALTASTEALDAGARPTVPGGTCGSPASIPLGQTTVVSLGQASEFGPPTCARGDGPDRVFERSLAPGEVLTVHARARDPRTVVGVSLADAASGCALVPCASTLANSVSQAIRNGSGSMQQVLVVLDSELPADAGSAAADLEVSATIEAEPPGTAQRPHRVTGSTVMLGLEPKSQCSGTPSTSFEIDLPADAGVRIYGTGVFIQPNERCQAGVSFLEFAPRPAARTIPFQFVHRGGDDADIFFEYSR